METDEERRGRLENDAATKQLRLAMETDKAKYGLQSAAMPVEVALQLTGQLRACQFVAVQMEVLLQLAGL